MIRLLSVVLLFAMVGCATPMAPTGGDPVRTSPQIRATYPDQGATNYSDRHIRFEFDRFMNRGSATRAVRIEPDFGIPYTIAWKRKTMVITFEQLLPDSVTVIVSLGTELSDVGNNRLGQPYQLAFSTGASVDSAGVDIATVSFDLVRGEQGKTVGLFRESHLNAAAVYMAESDTSGIVRFRHATPGIYQAVLFDDRNRNRQPDRGEWAFRATAPVHVSSDSMRVSPPITYTELDTVRPTILGIGLLSEHRLRVRFSEEALISEKSTITVRTGNDTVSAKWLYTEPGDASTGYSRSDVALVPSRSYNLLVDGVSDRQGNALEQNDLMFQGSSQPDTTLMRIIRMPTVDTVKPTDSLLIVYSDLLDGTSVLDSLTLIDGEQSIQPWTGYSISSNRLRIFRPGGWRVGQQYQLRTWNPAEQRLTSHSFRVDDVSNYGGVEVNYAGTWVNGHTIAELVIDGVVLFRSNNEGSVSLFESVPAGNYSMRVWIDRNGNGRWDPPHSNEQGEEVYVQRSVPVVSRMTSTIIVE